MKAFILSIGLLALMAFGVSAQQYGVHATLVNLQGTNVTATATNVAAILGANKFDSFALDVFWGLTNAATGSLDVRWDTSCDGSNFSSSPAAAGSSGWFSVPLTNAGLVGCWMTNLTVGDIGYWRINWITNNTGQSMTNIVIKAIRKYKTSG